MAPSPTAPRILLAPASGPGVGGGHVMRCLTLATALADRGAECSFAVGGAGAELIARFADAAFPVQRIVPSALGVAVAKARPDALVIDDYALDATVEQALRPLTRRLMVIDDLANRPHVADLILDPGFQRTAEDYRRWAPKAIVLAGPDYALVRAAFAQQRLKRPHTPRPSIDHIFVSFGLSDVDGITERAVQILTRIAPAARLEIALASDAPSVKPLSVASARDVRLRLHLDARNMAGLMADADLAVGAGGSAVWERATLGLPTLAVVVADNQRDLVRRLTASGYCAGADLADPAFEASFAAAFQWLNNPQMRRNLSTASAKLCDGRGAERAADELIWLIRR